VFGCALKFVLKAFVMPLLGADNEPHLDVIGRV
jgi:hypothetical protein